MGLHDGSNLMETTWRDYMMGLHDELTRWDYKMGLHDGNDTMGLHDGMT